MPRGRTKFHNPKNRDPDQLDPNTTGKCVASNRVNEDSAMSWQRGRASGLSRHRTRRCLFVGGEDSQRKNPHETKSSQEDHVGRNVFWMLRNPPNGMQAQIYIMISWVRVMDSQTGIKGERRTIVDIFALDERQTPNTYAA